MQAQGIHSRVLIVLLISGGVLGNAQRHGLPPEVERLPVWPGTASAARAMRGQYVFRDRDGEIVVSYPDPSDNTHNATFRFWLQNRVDPQISVIIGRDSEGQFEYHYTLRNGPDAKTGIWAWSVVGPPFKQLSISRPSWFGINSYSSVVAPQAMLKREAMGVYLRWDNWSAPILPGVELGNFEIIAALRPGLTTAFVSGKEAPIRPPTELTEEAEQQIIPLERAPVMFKPALTIGPRFSEQVTKRAILLTYRSDIEDSIASGVLDGQAPLVREIQRMIEQAIVSSQSKLEKPKQAPHNALERELVDALEAALSP